MTTPASGPISILDIKNEMGGTTSAQNIGWIKANSKDTVGGSTNTINDMNGFRNKAYYASYMYGNCNNGNCTETNCNCACDYNCQNCVNCAAVNCSNCDGTTNYLQPNCNSASKPTYNCTLVTHPYNCACTRCDCFWSDDNLKIREGSIPNALNIVRNLDGFYYTGNEKAKELNLKIDRDVGVSAQKIKEHFNVALGENIPYTDMMSVRYERLIPLLIEAIKELDKKII